MSKAQYYEQRQNQFRGREVLLMTIDIGDGRQGKLSVCENDNPLNLAIDFCRKHKLNQQLQGRLHAHIIANLKKLYEEPQIQHRQYEEPQIQHRQLQEQSQNRMQKSQSQIQNQQNYSELSFDNRSNYAQQSGLIKQSQESLQQNKALGNLNRIAVRQAEENQKMERSQQSSDSAQIGERLYSLGVFMKENKMRKNLKHQKEQQIQESESYTFTPTINKKFFSKDDSTVSGKSQEKRELKLMNFGKMYTKQIQIARNKIIQQEQMECSFQPTVNERSKILVQKANKSQSSDQKIHDQLYAEAKIREQRKREYLERAKEETPFKPNLSTTEHFRSIQAREGDIADRLMAYKEYVENKLEEKREQEQNNIYDPQTNQLLFQPKILRGPKDQSLIQYDKDKPRQDQLYEMHNEKLNKIEQIQQQQEQEIRQMQNNKLANKKSDILFEKIKNQKCKEIFDVLDEDEDGQISLEVINGNYFKQNQNIQDILQPIFDEMQQNNSTLSFQDFQKKFDSILSNLNIEQRNNFLGIQKKKFEPSTEQIETTFKPKINPISPKNLQPLNERMTEFIQRHKEKVQNQIDEKESRELDGCTFHPQVKNPTKPVEVMAQQTLQKISKKKDKEYTDQNEEVY